MLKPVYLRCPFCLKLNRIDLARAKDRPACGECAKPLLLDRPVKVTGEDFGRTVLEAGGPVLVDFYADWCAPCRVMAPTLDEVARELTGVVLVAKLDTEAAPEVAQQYGVRGIPTLILFQGGAEKARVTGAVGRKEILKMLEPARAPAAE